MPQTHYEEILSKIHNLQNQLEQELDQLVSDKREQFRYELKKGRVIFDKEIHELHKHHRLAIWPYLKQSKLAYILTSPIIYAVFFPLVLLDISVFIYQKICFRVYGIPMVLRKDYIIIDRQYLSYLNGIEKFNCIYCGYGNGLIEYTREVFARTEKFWCPVKHARRSLSSHQYVNNFADYGDVEIYREKLKALRTELINMQNSNS